MIVDPPSAQSQAPRRLGLAAAAGLLGVGCLASAAELLGYSRRGEPHVPIMGDVYSSDPAPLSSLRCVPPTPPRSSSVLTGGRLCTPSRAVYNMLTPHPFFFYFLPPKRPTACRPVEDLGIHPFVRTVGQPSEVWGSLLTQNTPLPTNSWWQNFVLGDDHNNPVKLKLQLRVHPGGTRAVGHRCRQRGRQRHPRPP